MNIDPINNGIVIDHIPAGRGMELYKYLELDKLDCEVALIMNAFSEKLGRKDIIKISDRIDINPSVLGFIGSDVTVNIIENGKNAGKTRPALPETLKNVIFCRNPRCITGSERGLPHIFRLTDREKRVYRCVYCDTRAEQNYPAGDFSGGG